MKRKGILSLLALAVCAMLIASCPAHASVVYTRLIDTSFIMTKWYDWISGTSGRMNFSSTTINGEKKLYTHNDVYELNMTGTLTFNPNMTRDFSSSGYARGYFEGGVTVKITGGLLLNGSYVYGGTGGAAATIFEAVLAPVYEDAQNPTLERWALQEDPMQAGSFDRTLFLSFEEGMQGLASGIALAGTGDILKMVSPKLDLYLKTTSTVNNFYTDIGPSGMASPIKITGLIPEPATLALLGLGLVFLRKTR